MAEDWRPHVVQQGDHLVKLAFRHGVPPDDVWTHPLNGDLAKRRASAAMLCPGDVLYLPATPPKGLPVRARSDNRYRIQVPKVTVLLRLVSSHTDFANRAFELRGLSADDPTAHGTTGPDGDLELSVPATARLLELHFPDTGHTFPLRVGDLDPPDEASGIAQRLTHLGYFPSGVVAPDAAALAAALRSFQRDVGLPPTGSLDRVTHRALLAEHGP
ncbi:MAG: peptidoglycan-binding protein [Acidobacteria bacterium]|nr:peptidoglycan-binding protein [Acidobacteriota bacterium]